MFKQLTLRGLAGSVTAATLAALLLSCSSLPTPSIGSGSDSGSNSGSNSGSGAPTRAERGAPAAAVSGDENLRIGELAPRNLGAGECGLFLWTRAASPMLVFFSNPTRGSGAIVVNGRELTLRRLDVRGGAGGERYGDQIFTTASGDIRVELTINESEPLENGVRVPSAALNVVDEAGWNTVLTVGGLAACQP